MIIDVKAEDEIIYICRSRRTHCYFVARSHIDLSSTIIQINNELFIVGIRMTTAFIFVVLYKQNIHKNSVTFF